MLLTGFTAAIQLPGRLFSRWKGQDACLVPTVLSTVTCPISGLQSVLEYQAGWVSALAPVFQLSHFNSH